MQFVGICLKYFELKSTKKGLLTIFHYGLVNKTLSDF